MPLQEGHLAFSTYGYTASRQAQHLGSRFQEDFKDILRCGMMSFCHLELVKARHEVTQGLQEETVTILFN